MQKQFFILQEDGDKQKMVTILQTIWATVHILAVLNIVALHAGKKIMPVANFHLMYGSTMHIIVHMLIGCCEHTSYTTFMVCESVIADTLYVVHAVLYPIEFEYCNFIINPEYKYCITLHFQFTISKMLYQCRF